MLSPQPTSPAELLHHCATATAGHGGAWRMFVREYGPTLRAGARRGLERRGRVRAEPADVEDMVQEVYCRLLSEGRRRLRRCPTQGTQTTGAYLHRLAVRVVLDHHRREAAVCRGGRDQVQSEGWYRRLEKMPARPMDPEQRLILRDWLRGSLRCYVGDRTSRRRDVQIWLLATAGGFSHQEIIQLMPGSLNINQVSKALARVRHYLGAMGEGIDSLL